MKYTSFFILIALLSSCTARDRVTPNSASGEPQITPTPPVVASPTPPIVQTEINGIWKTGCHIDSDSPETTFQVKTAKFNADGTLEYISEAHKGTDRNCAGEKVLTTILQGRFKAPEAGEARPLDMNFERRILIPGGLESVRMFNEMKVCGITDWAAGVARDVSGMNCESGTGSAVQNVFSVLRVEKDSFSLGKDTIGADGSSPEKRHSSLSDIRFTKSKQ